MIQQKAETPASVVEVDELHISFNQSEAEMIMMMMMMMMMMVCLGSNIQSWQLAG